MAQEGFKRKLTSIFSADAVGYSRLMGEDEAATVHTITSNRKLISSLIKQHDEAIASCEKALSLNPNGADTHAFFGLALCCTDRNEQGIKHLKKAMRLNPMPPTYYWLLLGAGYSMAGQYEKAITCCQKVIRENPDDIQANLILTGAYGRAGFEEKARLAAQNVLRIDPGYSLNNYSNTSFLKNKAKLQRSIEVLRQAGLPD